MVSSVRNSKFLERFIQLHQDKVRYNGPLILRMFGELNKLNLRTENRYILCNFLDQYSDVFQLKDDIYQTNNEKSLNQLFIMTYNIAQKFNLLKSLYDEYLTSIRAISEKKEFQYFNENELHI